MGKLSSWDAVDTNATLVSLKDLRLHLPTSGTPNAVVATLLLSLP
jgi:hypothetical protein